MARRSTPACSADDGHDPSSRVRTIAAHSALSLRGGIPDTALGFQRLKILDLSERGHQPMISPDGSTSLLFNGEIYNAFDHKAELERDGYRFRTGTDTEVVLALYERDWGSSGCSNVSMACLPS